MLAQRLASDRHQFTRLDLIRQSYGEHADPGSLDLPSFSGCFVGVIRLSVGDDDADVVDVWAVAVVASEDGRPHESQS